MNGRWSLLPERASSQLPTAACIKAQQLNGVDCTRSSSCRRVASGGSRSVGAGGSSTCKGSTAATAHASAVQQECVSAAAGQLSGSHSSTHWLTVGFPDHCSNRLCMSQQQVQQLHQISPATAASCGDRGDRQLQAQGVVLQPAAGCGQLPSVSRSSVSSDQLKYRITQLIKSCVTWQEMVAVVQEHGPVLNHIHVSAAITHLAQLSRRRQDCSEHPSQQTAQQQQHCDNVQLVPGLQQLKQQMAQQHQLLHLDLGGQLQHHAPQQVVAQHPSQDHLLQWLLTQAVCRLSLLQSRQVANILWSLAQFDYPWQANVQVAAAVTALANRATQLLHTAESQHLANIAYAAAKLKLPVSQDWVQQLQDAWLVLVQQDAQWHQQQQRQGSGIDSSRRQAGRGSTAPRLLSVQSAATFTWALAHLQQQPQQEWVQQHLGMAASDLQHWPPRSLAVMLWSCAKLGFCFQRHKKQRPATAGSSSCVLQQRHQVQCAEEADIPALVVGALQQQYQLFSLQDVAQVLWAATLMQLQLPGPLLQQLLEAGGKQLHRIEAQQPAVALTRRAAASEQAAIASAAGAAAVAHSVSLVLWSLARQGVTAQHQLPPLLLKPWLTALIAASAEADSQSLAVAAWAVCRLKLAGSCTRVLPAMIQAASQHQQQQPGRTGSTAAGTNIVSSRAMASLVWAAGHCIRAAADSGSAKQKAGHSEQQQYIRQQVLQRNHSVYLTGWSGAAAATPAVVSSLDHCSSSDQLAVQAGAQQLLLATAGLTRQQIELQQHHNQKQQLQQIITDMAVPGASLRDLSQILWGVGIMQLPLPAAWWQRCFQQLTRLLQQHHSSPAAQQQFAQSLAILMWGLGMSMVEVPLSLMALLQTASRQVLQPSSTALSPQGHVMILVGFTRMCTAVAYRLPRRVKVGSSLQVQLREASDGPQMQDIPVVVASSRHSAMQEQLHHCILESDVRLSDDHRLSSAPVFEQLQIHKQDSILLGLHEQKLGVTCRPRLVACAGLQPSWLHQFCISAGGKLKQLPPDGLVALMWALGRLKYHPGCHFLDAALQRLQALLPQCSARHLSVLMWALIRLEHIDDALVQKVLQAWEPLIASASKADTKQMDWALDKLSHFQTSAVAV